MINRQQRDKLIQMIQDFLSGEIDAHQFGGSAYDFPEIEDEVVDKIIFEIQTAHEDGELIESKDLDQRTWDYYQRWLLLLASDGQYQSTKRVETFRKTRIACWIALGVYLIGAWQIGFNGALVLLGFPFSWIGFWLCHWRSKQIEAAEPKKYWERERMDPFTSYQEICQVKRRMHDHKKVRFKDRLIKSELGKVKKEGKLERLVLGVMAGIWVPLLILLGGYFGPLPLLFYAIDVPGIESISFDNATSKLPTAVGS